MQKSGFHSARAALIACVAFSTLIQACAGNAAPATKPAPVPSPTIVAAAQAPALRPLESTACRDYGLSSDVKCYDLIVPEHHDAANGRSLRLHVAVFKSTAPDRVLDPILFLMGGPGSPGIATYAWGARQFPPFAGRRDVVVLDQRGTGGSIPKLNCPEYGAFTRENLSKNRSIADSASLAVAAYRVCRDRLVSQDIDLTAYNNSEIAADVEDLRRAMGIERWNLYGWSYGTRVALTVMRDFPHSVRSAVLDSVYPPRVNQLDEFAKNTQATLHRLFDRCAADAKCNKAFPDVEKAFYQLLDQLDAHPVQAGGALVNSDKFIDLVLTLLFDPNAIPQLPQLIYEAHSGDYLLLQSKAWQVFSDDDSFADGMELSVDCGDEFSFTSPSTVAAASAGVDAHLVHLSDRDAQEVFGACAIWGARKAPAIETAPVVSDIPALILAGDIDPFTPPAWARLTASTLSHSHVAEFPGLGHGLFLANALTSQCISRLVDDFLDHPVAELEMKCIEAFRAQPRGFVTP